MPEEEMTRFQRIVALDDARTEVNSARDRLASALSRCERALPADHRILHELKAAQKSTRIAEAHLEEVIAQLERIAHTEKL